VGIVASNLQPERQEFNERIRTMSVIEMDIETVAFVTLDETSYDLLLRTQILCPIQWEDTLYFGVSVPTAECFSEDEAESPEVRDVLAGIIAEAKRHGFEGYLFVS
jgi:hypothetical protein